MSLAFGLVCFPGYLLRPLLCFLSDLQGVSCGAVQRLLRLFLLLLRLPPGFGCEFPGLLLGFVQGVLSLPSRNLRSLPILRQLTLGLVSDLLAKALRFERGLLENLIRPLLGFGQFRFCLLLRPCTSR